MDPRKWSSYGAKGAKFLSLLIPVAQSSIFPCTLGMQSVDRSLQTAGLLRKEEKQPQSQADGLGAAQTRAPRGKTRLLGSLPREQGCKVLVSGESCSCSGNGSPKFITL